ncbi:amidase [Pseudonocardia hispaniensis]|uniref:Amidase n=1 Tax=Pseudonocardia hispaniensis TaxID=904933 RepID=A0ABW1J6A1_9PSEU
MPAGVSADVRELAGLDAAGLAALVREGRVTAVEVARAHLARIIAADCRVGALTAVDRERVLAEAHGVDARPDRFALPLAGVPVAIGDDVDVAGFPTRYGCAASSSAPARRDDELVKRLRAAGAVVVGKARTPGPAAWGFAHDPVSSAPGPGGCGGAAAVAAGMAALAVGTDGGGAIRMSAAYLGLVGLKPGVGVVSPTAAERRWCGLSEPGPIARTADDATLMLEALSGRRIGDLAAVGLPNRVAVSLHHPWPVGRLRPAQHDAVRKAVRRFAECRIRTVAAEPPYPSTLVLRWLRRWQAGVARDVEALGIDPRGLEPHPAAVVRKGRRVLRRGIPEPDTAFRDRFVGWLDEGGNDLLVLPAVAGPAVPADELAGRGYLSALVISASRAPYTQAWNVAGLPALVVPVRWGVSRVPVQLVGRPGSEPLLLATAARLERD